MTTAVHPLKTALIVALRAANTNAGQRVHKTPIAQELKTWPRIAVYGEMEDPSNFFGRPGNEGRMLVRCEVICKAGDDPLEELAAQVEAALDNQPIEMGDHELIIGTLRRTIPKYPDPDIANLWLLPMLYESETRVA